VTGLGQPRTFDVSGVGVPYLPACFVVLVIACGAHRAAATRRPPGIGPELRVEDGRRTSLVLLGPRGEHRDDDAHGVAGGSKMMGKTTDTIPPSGWGKLRFEKPRTTHATTEASLIAVDVSVALLMTLPCLSITNFVATVPVNFGSACNPCDGTTVRGNRTGGYSCSARSVRPRALANQRRSPRRARSNQSSASASASPPSTRALGPACPTAAASASRCIRRSSGCSPLLCCPRACYSSVICSTTCDRRGQRKARRPPTDAGTGNEQQ